MNKGIRIVIGIGLFFILLVVYTLVKEFTQHLEFGLRLFIRGIAATASFAAVLFYWDKTKPAEHS